MRFVVNLINYYSYEYCLTTVLYGFNNRNVLEAALCNMQTSLIKQEMSHTGDDSIFAPRR